MDAYNFYTAVSAGLFGRRVVSGPATLTKLKAQTFKEYTVTEINSQKFSRRALPPPPYTPAVEAAQLDEPGSYLASPIRPFPRRRKDIAPKMQRGGPGVNSKANSCPPLIGLGLGVEFKRGEDPIIASDEEVGVSKGTPDLTSRRRQSGFQAIHEYAKHARARAQIELDYVVPIAYCEVEPLVAPKNEYHAPPEYYAHCLEAENSEATEATEVEYGAEYGYPWGCGYESQAMSESDSGASEVGGTIYYVRNIVEYGGMDAPGYHSYW
ncbi:hypothetical protein BDV93DRAFT_570875 [Ceratobasidium sp. AG-I]|nr:hypothetical protein BDV93DRAFT_570875 [Ceratobasidium sp. AG-I]